MFDISTINKVRYFPELLPGSDVYTSIVPGMPATPAPLDLRRFSPLVVDLVNLSFNADANIEMEVRADKNEVRKNTVPYDPSKVYDELYIAKDYLSLNLYNIGTAPVTNYRIMYGLWVYKPNILSKIIRKWPLTPEEEATANRLKLYDLAKRARIWPRLLTLESECPTLSKLVYSKRITVPTQPNSETVLQVYAPEDDDFLVLRGFSCSNTSITNYITLTIDRDEDKQYIIYKTPAIGNVSTVECWIPALNEIKITATAVTEAIDVNFNFTILKARLTDIHRVRWNIEIDKLPPDLIESVKGGVV